MAVCKKDNYNKIGRNRLPSQLFLYLYVTSRTWPSKLDEQEAKKKLGGENMHSLMKNKIENICDYN